MRKQLTNKSLVPVAYQVRMSDGRWGTIFHHPDKPLGDHRPLYAHPSQPSETVAEADQFDRIHATPDAVARLVEAAPISIYPCKMCGEGVHDEGVILTVETLIDPSNAEAYHAIGYTVRCCACGTSVSNEYRDDAVSLWNGEPSALRALKGSDQ